MDGDGGLGRADVEAIDGERGACAWLPRSAVCGEHGAACGGIG